jgi:hypothetical protein
MGLSELISKISASDAECAIVVSTWRGNPGDLTFLLPTGQEALVLRVEGTKLRREMSENGRVRIGKLGCVALKSGSEKDAIEIGRLIASFFRASVVEVPSPPSDGNPGEAAAWFETMPSGKILWTFYHMLDGTEIGPRIRVRILRRHHEL